MLDKTVASPSPRKKNQKTGVYERRKNEGVICVLNDSVIVASVKNRIIIFMLRRTRVAGSEQVIGQTTKRIPDTVWSPKTLVGG